MYRSTWCTSLARAVLATFVGGTAAEWHVRRRGVVRLNFLGLARRKQIVWLLVAVAPFLFLALSYRP